MGKKVKVVTRCGEEHVYTYDQDVSTVEIIERQKYKLQDTLNHIKELYDEGCPNVSCDNCAFHINTNSCAFVKIIDAIREAQGYDKSS